MTVLVVGLFPSILETCEKKSEKQLQITHLFVKVAVNQKRPGLTGAILVYTFDIIVNNPLSKSVIPIGYTRIFID